MGCRVGEFGVNDDEGVFSYLPPNCDDAGWPFLLIANRPSCTMLAI